MLDINGGTLRIRFAASSFVLPTEAWEASYDNPNGSVSIAGRPLTWQTQAGKSASAAVAAFRNPAAVTRAECLTGVQIVVLTAVLRTLGPGAFDALHRPAGSQRALHGIGVPVVRPSGTSVDRHLIAVRSVTLRQSSAGITQEPSDGITQAVMVPGDYVYMSNIPDYERWYPNGAWNGENAIYLGGGRFYGLGLGQGAEGQKTEAQLQQEMANAYTWGDLRFLARRQAAPQDMHWTLLASPVRNGNTREAGPFVR
jgi:hypothetical protein